MGIASLLMVDATRQWMLITFITSSGESPSNETHSSLLSLPRRSPYSPSCHSEKSLPLLASSSPKKKTRREAQEQSRNSRFLIFFLPALFEVKFSGSKRDAMRWGFLKTKVQAIESCPREAAESDFAVALFSAENEIVKHRVGVLLAGLPTGHHQRYKESKNSIGVVECWARVRETRKRIRGKKTIKLNTRNNSNLKMLLISEQIIGWDTKF